MRLHTTRIFAAAIMAAALAAGMQSCEIETSHNGDLDGFWHLTGVDTLATGGKRDLAHAKYYWAVQARLLQLHNRTEQPYAFFMRFEHKGDSLRVHSPYEDNRAEGDVKIENPQRLNEFGISALDETFHVDALNGKRMVLRGKTVTLSFRKM